LFLCPAAAGGDVDDRPDVGFPARSTAGAEAPTSSALAEMTSEATNAAVAGRIARFIFPSASLAEAR